MLSVCISRSNNIKHMTAGLTIFACPRSFTDPHIAIIQYNAITSWTLLQPKPEVILFGDEDGTDEICKKLDLRHIPDVARSKFGTPLVSDIFEKAQQLATHEILCYVNADIILMSDFMESVMRISSIQSPFLGVGSRWDIDLNQQVDFTVNDWDKHLREYVRKCGKFRGLTFIDFFCFRRGFYKKIVPFAIGRLAWDLWLIHYATKRKALVIDISSVCIVIHQNHEKIVNSSVFDKELKYNIGLYQSPRKTLYDATHILTNSGLKKIWWREPLKILWAIHWRGIYLTNQILELILRRRIKTFSA